MLVQYKHVVCSSKRANYKAKVKLPNNLKRLEVTLLKHPLESVVAQMNVFLLYISLL